MSLLAVKASDLEPLRRLLSAELGPYVGIAMQSVHGDLSALYPEESAAVVNAIPRRKREFAAGRESVRNAMHQIGWPALAVPCAADRSPIWPDGLVGSISHSSTACLTMVAPKAFMSSIGVDIEDHRPIEPNLWGTICTPEEKEALLNLPEATQGLIVAQLFSAKEAVYKWQYPLTGRMLDFHDVHVELRPETQNFVARIASPDRSADSAKRVLGRFATDPHHIVSWMLSKSGS